MVDSQRWSGFALLIGFNDTFFMSLMFFLSGLFVWRSLARKGAAGFLRDRVLRLGVPFVIAAALIAPLAYLPDLSPYWNIHGIRWVLASVAIARRLAGVPEFHRKQYQCVTAALCAAESRSRCFRRHEWPFYLAR